MMPVFVNPYYIDEPCSFGPDSHNGQCYWILYSACWWTLYRWSIQKI